SGIFTLLSWGFIKLILVSLFLAIPVGWLLMDEFLGDVNNRVDLSWQLFAFAGLVGLVVAAVTISYETLKAALINPAKGLRSE
ncbi:MAG: ABC transporter permease, partial [Marinoscillum sp.]